jgi:trehalose utilization protein
MSVMSRVLFLLGGIAAFAIPSIAAPRSKASPIRVVVWDERQPAQKAAYENFLGNALAEYLQKVGEGKTGGSGEFTVKSVGLDDPDQGLSKETLDACDVLVWWGHQRHADVKDELARDIVQRVEEGHLALISLHSAHWSKPFIEAMNARTLQDAAKSLKPSERGKVKIVALPADRRLMAKTERLTPYMERKKSPDGVETLEVKLPGCAFSDVRADGKPSHLRLLVKNHPLAAGLPDTFDVPQTEMYNGPFHVPHPDVTLFQETWDSGEEFESGSLWRLGKGTIFYFRPGHETFPIFKQPVPLKVVENAVRWMGAQVKRH